MVFLGLPEGPIWLSMRRSETVQPVGGLAAPEEKNFGLEGNPVRATAPNERWPWNAERRAARNSVERVMRPGDGLRAPFNIVDPMILVFS